MNLILLFKEDFVDGKNRVRLEGRRFKHVLEVHRAAIGDELSVGLMNGRWGTGKVTVLDQTTLEMDVSLEHKAPQPLPLTLILALPRPKVLRRVLRSVGAMGVKRIILLNSFRVEKSYWKSPVLSTESLNEQLTLGLEQARDTIMPEVLLRLRFKPFVQDELPAIAHDTLPLVAHPESSFLCPRNPGRKVTLVVGPEGGFIPYEIEMLAGCGFTPVQLGERILSVETVVPALLSRLF